jgi:hypothetical protein
MKRKELNKILELHEMWLEGDPEGKRAYFYRADLRGAAFHGAALRSAFVREADLTGADLSYADLRGANLSGADLRGANICGAKVFGVRLHGTKLPQKCKYYCNLPRHNIVIIHDIIHIGCFSMQLSEWLLCGRDIGKARGYTPEQIEVYMEILRREHERKRTK